VHGKVEIAAVHQYRAVPERVAFGIRRREVGDHCRLLRDCDSSRPSRSRSDALNKPAPTRLQYRPRRRNAGQREVRGPRRLRGRTCFHQTSFEQGACPSVEGVGLRRIADGRHRGTQEPYSARHSSQVCRWAATLRSLAGRKRAERIEGDVVEHLSCDIMRRRPRRVHCATAQAASNARFNRAERQACVFAIS